MKEVDYYYSTNRQCFDYLADSFSKAAGEKIIVENNRFELPPSLGKGRNEFYELTDGLAMIIVDCVFYEELSMKRKAIEGNEHYKILLNITESHLIKLHQGDIVPLSNSLANAIFFSSHTTESESIYEANAPVKAIHIIFNRSWGANNLLHNAIPLGIKRLQQFANNRPMQFITKFDLRSYELVEDILALDITDFTLPRMLEGYARQLVALFFNNIVLEEIGEKHLVSKEAMRVIQLKENIEQNPEDIMPPLEEAAMICLMSKSRFSAVFKILFQKTYGAFCLEVKMELAKKMLEKGESVNTVGLKVGYNNIGHFVRMFKEHFGTTPGKYQRDNLRQNRDMTT